MIASLRGTVINQFEDSIIIDVNGVGYGVYISQIDLNNVPLDQEVNLFIYEHIREQSHDLFGFLLIETKHFFEQLLDVNGVGPKMALKILDIGNITDIKNAISSSNALYIKQASGVGQKLAERIIIELKNKLVAGFSTTTTFASTLNQIGSNDEALQALTSLGFSVNDATRALVDIDKSLPLEEQIKLALRDRKL